MHGAAIALALALPTTAYARNDCASIDALLAPDNSKLRHLSVGFDRAGLLELRYRGKADVIAGASDCELSSPRTYFETGCSWDFDTNAAASREKIEELRLEMARCMPVLLVDTMRESGVDRLIIEHKYDATIETTDGGDVDVSLQLFQYTRDNSPSHFKVHLTFSR